MEKPWSMAFDLNLQGASDLAGWERKQLGKSWGVGHGAFPAVARTTGSMCQGPGGSEVGTHCHRLPGPP